jgi:predicted TPR repeat methyltransferase
MTADMSGAFRSVGRSLLYRTPLHHVERWARRRLGSIPVHRSQEYWDRELSGRLKPYLGGTVSIEVRNAVTAQLLRAAVPDARAVLDVGCAAGTLAKTVRASGVERYVGVDISAVAIREADLAAGEFLVADLHGFDPGSRGPFDAIVFNEVLYYAEVDDAVAQLARYARHLTPRGVLVFSLKNDPKSRLILEGAKRDFAWVSGVVFQEQADAGRWVVRADRARPAYLVAVVRPR